MKKILMMFASVCLLVFTAVSFSSCSNSDDGTILTGTTWEGTVTSTKDGNLDIRSITISFGKDHYEGYLSGTGPVDGSYSVSSDNKTVYIEAEIGNGQTIGKISADGKTMELSNPNVNLTGTLTKK